MRISDWSSDVCSSDLLLPLLSLSFPRDHQAAARTAAPLGLSMELDDREAGYAGAGCGDQAGNSDLSQAALDRKSVVEGQSVTVRVDLGGRRIIKKQEHRNQPTKTIRSTHQRKI